MRGAMLYVASGAASHLRSMHTVYTSSPPRLNMNTAARCHCLPVAQFGTARRILQRVSYSDLPPSDRSRLLHARRSSLRSKPVCREFLVCICECCFASVLSICTKLLTLQRLVEVEPRIRPVTTVALNELGEVDGLLHAVDAVVLRHQP